MGDIQSYSLFYINQFIKASLVSSSVSTHVPQLNSDPYRSMWMELPALSPCSNIIGKTYIQASKAYEIENGDCSASLHSNCATPLYTDQNYKHNTFVFAPIFSWAALLLCWDNPSTSQVWHFKMLIRQHDYCTGVP